MLTCGRMYKITRRNVMDKHIEYKNIEDMDSQNMSLHDGGSYDLMKQHTQGNYTIEDYRALPDDVRAELIDGNLFYMEAPVPLHQSIIVDISSQFLTYIKKHKKTCRTYVGPIDVQLNHDDYTVVQPDVAVLCKMELLHENCIYGAPDFVLEVISPSTKKNDYSTKLTKYQTAGVREYWILDPYQKKLIVYFFESEESFVTIYGLDQPIPVHIFDGDMVIDLSDIAGLVEEYSKDN
jgi:Uma2 family endonuclease